MMPVYGLAEDISSLEENLVKTVTLFDLDGVLIKPGGYRAAFHAAMNYFLDKMGLNLEIGPQEHDLVIFESYGVTAEWDMLPVSLLIIFESYHQHFNEEIKLFNLQQALTWVAGHSPMEIIIDYEQFLARLAPYFWLTSTPAESVLCACQNGHGDQLFPHLFQQPLLLQLLSNTRNALVSLTTRLLQNFQLGSEIFEQIYQIPAEVETKSTLQVNDRSLISESNRLELIKLLNQKRIFMSYVTLRPSYPPKELSLSKVGYPPEAELALEKMDLLDVPLIAYGRMQYLAGKLNIPTASLVKPYPYQALAGIKAALDGEELPALSWVGKIYQLMHSIESKDHTGLPALADIDRSDELDIHIFEDMPVGIRSAREASDMLRKFGMKIRFTAWGIAYDERMKAVLSGEGGRVFNDINIAFQEFLKLM